MTDRFYKEFVNLYFWWHTARYYTTSAIDCRKLNEQYYKYARAAGDRVFDTIQNALQERLHRMIAYDAIYPLNSNLRRVRMMVNDGSDMDYSKAINIICHFAITHRVPLKRTSRRSGYDMDWSESEIISKLLTCNYREIIPLQKMWMLLGVDKLITIYTTQAVDESGFRQKHTDLLSDLGVYKKYCQLFEPTIDLDYLDILLLSSLPRCLVEIVWTYSQLDLLNEDEENIIIDRLLTIQS